MGRHDPIADVAILTELDVGVDEAAVLRRCRVCMPSVARGHELRLCFFDDGMGVCILGQGV